MSLSPLFWLCWASVPILRLPPIKVDISLLLEGKAGIYSVPVCKVGLKESWINMCTRMLGSCKEIHCIVLFGACDISYSTFLLGYCNHSLSPGIRGRDYAFPCPSCFCHVLLQWGLLSLRQLGLNHFYWMHCQNLPSLASQLYCEPNQQCPSLCYCLLSTTAGRVVQAVGAGMEGLCPRAAGPGCYQLLGIPLHSTA